MELPEEDLGPAWMRDYEYIMVELTKLVDFARSLQDDLTTNYIPHVQRAFDDLATEAPGVDMRFHELRRLLEKHHIVAQDTGDQLWTYINGTNRFAVAAERISADYGEADALADARVKDVEREFGVSVRPDTEEAP